MPEKMDGGSKARLTLTKSNAEQGGLGGKKGIMVVNMGTLLLAVFFF